MTTTNVDIIPISSLPSIERTTVGDTFIVNDDDGSGNISTKVISATNLAADLGARININELVGVSLDNPQTGNVIKWNGTAWVPAQDLVGQGGAGISLTDLNAVTASTGVGSGSLVYNNLQGIFTFTPPLLTLENMDNVNNQVPTTGQFLRWGGTYWYPSSIDDTALIVENSETAAASGALSLAGDVLTYTPPDLSSYLTAEADPIFSASAASGITNADITNWNQLLIDIGEQDTLNDLADVSTNGFTPAEGMVLTYDSATGIWFPKNVPQGSLGDLTDVYTQGAEANDIIKYDGAQWRAQPNPSTSVTAGPGLYGGGTGSVNLGVRTGQGIGIVNNAVTLSADLGDLNNVNVSTASNGSVLVYQGGNWIPGSGGGGGGGLGATSLGELSDVNTAGQSQGKVLTYINNNWVPREPSGSGGAVNVQIWGYIRFKDNGKKEIINGSGNFTLGQDPGKGRVKIEFNESGPTDYYHVSVTVLDSEGDHMSGLMRQNKQGFLMYSRDLEGDGGSGFDNGDEPGALSFTAYW